MSVSLFIEQLPVAVILLDEHGVITHANPPAQALLPLAQTVSQSQGDSGGQLPPLEGMPWSDVVSQVFRPRADDGLEVSLVDGRRLKMQLAPRTDQPGQMILLTDLTETRHLQQQLSQMQRLGTIGRMVAKLAHQIRTPLSAALLYGTQLSQGMVPAAKQQHFANRIVTRLQELEQQINDLLLFARSGERPLVEPLALDPLLAELEHTTAAVLAQHGCRLELPPVAGLSLMANSTSVTGALANLIENAAQACSESAQPGLIRVVQRVQGNGVLLTVSDNGPGIPAALQEQVLEPFFTTRSAGTGLGLAVVRQVVAAHQGRLSIGQSELGGAAISLWLPQSAAEPALPSDRSQPAQPAHTVNTAHTADTAKVTS